MSRATFIFLIFALVACGERNLPGITPSIEIAPAEVPLQNPTELKRSLKATVLEHYSQLTLSNLDAYVDAFPKNTDIEILGVQPEMEFAGNSDALTIEDPRFFKDKHPQLLAKNLEVRVIAGTSIGWVYDEISYRVSHGEHLASLPIRRSGVYRYRGGRWLLLQEHWSYPAAPGTITALFENDSLENSVVPKALADGLETHVQGVSRTVNRFNKRPKRDALISSESPLLISLGLESEFRGPPPRVARFFGPKARIKIRGLRIHVDASAKAAWVSASLQIGNALGSNNGQRIPLRATYVLVRSESGAWRFQHMHISSALTETQLMDLILGETVK